MKNSFPPELLEACLESRLIQVVGEDWDELRASAESLVRSFLGESSLDGVISYVSPRPSYEISRIWCTCEEELTLGKQVDVDYFNTIGFLENSWRIRSPTQLSGGETARLVLASHLIQDRRVVILDHVLGELDIGARRTAINAMLRSGLVVILESTGWPLASILVEADEDSTLSWRINEAEGPSESTLDSRALMLRHVASVDTGSPTLQLTDFTVFRGDERIVDGVSFCANGGDLVEIVGPNGCGKTTLIEGIVGFHRTEGVADLPVSTTRPKVSLSPQDPDEDITEATLTDELSRIAGGPSFWNQLWVKGKMPAALDKDRIESFPLRSSLAHRKLASVVSALAQQPAIAFLDEPSLYLGNDLRNVVVAAIFSFILQGGTAFFISHDRRFAEKLAREVGSSCC